MLMCISGGGEGSGVVLRSIVTIFATIFIFQIAVAPALAERKIAFVVGIDRYDNLGPQQQLQRAVNDARSVGAAFASLGFEVVRAENVGRGAFNAEWQKFLDKLQPDDMAAIYFSGHGVEIEGLNFLLPRDVPNISYGRQEHLKRESLSVSELLLDLRKRKPKVTLVILDACRDNPLLPPEQRSLNWGAGLARMDAPTGTFIMYSAGVGETALDRLPGNDPDKVNSLYTRRLLPLVKTPGLPLHELARQLRLEVHDLAATVPHVQQPAYYDGLIGKFCLAGCKASSSVPAPKTVSSLPAVKPVQPPEQRAETSHLAFVSEYVRELGENERTRALGEKEVGEQNADADKYVAMIRGSTRIIMELRSQIRMLKNMTLNKPYDTLPASIAEFYSQKINVHNQVIAMATAFLSGPQPGVDYSAMVAEAPKLTAMAEYIDRSLAETTPLIFATLIDEKPDKNGHMSRLSITRAERDALGRSLERSFGKKLDQANQNYIVSSASVLRHYLSKKGYKCSDDPW
jgi:hypothetical protein